MIDTLKSKVAFKIVTLDICGNKVSGVLVGGSGVAHPGKCDRAVANADGPCVG